MLFNSPVYIFLFLPVVVFIYFSLNKYRLITVGKIWLIISSLFFYGYWNSDYLLLITTSIVVNYFIGSILIKSTKLSNGRRKYRNKIALIIGIVFNIGLLGYYKYSNFFIVNINSTFGSDLHLYELILPLAISFFTFQQVSYLVDSYYDEAHEYDFLNYCLFVTFFPQLIAGPIVHHKEMMPQFKRKRGKILKWKNITVGSFIFFIGLFKKVVIADTFATWANAGFSSNEVLSFVDAWGASLSYTFQLYYDFSGYTDMAIGAALLFNIHLPINFNSPYKALSIQQFWNCWHMTLSRWLKDYLYIPLGGNREGNFKTYRNLMLTFIIGGLWHGAGWTFIVWGVLHGTALCLHRVWTSCDLRMSTWLAWLLTFLFVNITWVFFRADDLSSALLMLTSMLDVNSLGLSFSLLDQLSSIFHISLHDAFTAQIEASVVSEWSLVASLLGLIAVVSLKNSVQIKNDMLTQSDWLTGKRIVLMSMVTAVSLSFLFISSSKEFLYFNF